MTEVTLTVPAEYAEDFRAGLALELVEEAGYVAKERTPASRSGPTFTSWTRAWATPPSSMTPSGCSRPPRPRAGQGPRWSA
jgi:hypothetical protein